jgi:hypothetical protein
MMQAAIFVSSETSGVNSRSYFMVAVFPSVEIDVTPMNFVVPQRK